jgi:mono/diheme cytochrome c family protein
MRSTWLVCAVAVSITIGAVDVARAQEIGKEDYLKYCSRCHGLTGKGDGPNAKGLGKPLADLTKLSQSTNGIFPLLRVYSIMDGRLEILIHGPRDMPNIFETFKKDVMSRRGDYMSAELVESLARLRMIEVIQYIMSLQSK